MDSWAYVAAGYALAAVVLGVYAGSLYRRAARLRRLLEAMREEDER